MAVGFRLCTACTMRPRLSTASVWSPRSTPSWTQSQVTTTPYLCRGRASSAPSCSTGHSMLAQADLADFALRPLRVLRVGEGGPSSPLRKALAARLISARDCAVPTLVDRRRLGTGRFARFLSCICCSRAHLRSRSLSLVSCSSASLRCLAELWSKSSGSVSMRSFKTSRVSRCTGLAQCSVVFLYKALMMMGNCLRQFLVMSFVTWSFLHRERALSATSEFGLEMQIASRFARASCTRWNSGRGIT
mmetsp:Transcript_44712/g.127605  ORF Transcript_44712/g.127605 Transcript_44712/m.127605 type:complete len:247 (-) Transcript_44712:1229-1969(-)